MKITKLFLVIFMSISISTVFAQEKTSHSERKHSEEGEESGIELAVTDKYDAVRNGAKLILTFDAKTNSFIGTVKNTTDKTLPKVRVEVHLSNGIELGPTKPTDLEPGNKMSIKLPTKSKDFKGWTAHPEFGSGELEQSEGHGEHGRERDEHKREHKSEYGERH